MLDGGRYAHWYDRGVWPRLMAYLQADPDLSAVLLDSTVVAEISYETVRRTLKKTN